MSKDKLYKSMRESVKYMQKLSSEHIIKKLLERDVYYFTPEFLSNYLDTEKDKVYNLLKTLQRKGLVERVEKGKYLVLGFEPDKVLSRPNYIANRIVTPSYISFWNALNFYGFTEQVPRRITLVSTKRKDDMTFKGYRFRYVRFKPRRFFGYTREGEEFSFLIADEEKAIIDSIFLPDHAGGIKEVFKALKRSIPEINEEKLMDYAVGMGNKSLCARLGFMLDYIGEEGKRLKKYLPKAPVKLAIFKEREGDIDNGWKIYKNIDLED